MRGACAGSADWRLRQRQLSPSCSRTGNAGVSATGFPENRHSFCCMAGRESSTAGQGNSTCGDPCSSMAPPQSVAASWAHARPVDGRPPTPPPSTLTHAHSQRLRRPLVALQSAQPCHSLDCRLTPSEHASCEWPIPPPVPASRGRAACPRAHGPELPCPQRNSEKDACSSGAIISFSQLACLFRARSTSTNINS